MTVTAQNANHVSVLLQEVIKALMCEENRACKNPWFLDGTLGLAGHSKLLLQEFSKLGIQANLCGLDRDPDALTRACTNLEEFKSQCHLFESDYASFETILPEIHSPLFNGVLLDLGVSSLQLDVAERGFSYHKEGPLNMRMDKGYLPQKEAKPWSETAYSFVNKADFNTLKHVIEELGEDPQAGRIARAILDKRQEKLIENTKELADIVYYAYPAKWRANARNHPATRTFQAIRMYVNDELGQLSRFLDKVIDLMALLSLSPSIPWKTELLSKNLKNGQQIVFAPHTYPFASAAIKNWLITSPKSLFFPPKKNVSPIPVPAVQSSVSLKK